MVRMQITLSQNEAKALNTLAMTELRQPRDQIRLILRQELTRRGLLPPAHADHADSVQSETQTQEMKT